MPPSQKPPEAEEHEDNISGDYLAAKALHLCGTTIMIHAHELHVQGLVAPSHFQTPACNLKPSSTSF